MYQIMRFKKTRRKTGEVVLTTKCAVVFLFSIDFVEIVQKLSIFCLENVLIYPYRNTKFIRRLSDNRDKGF